MNWTNNNFQHFAVRDTQYNKSVCLNRTNLDKITSKFDNIFDVFVNFTDEISSIQLYPFKILPYRNPNGTNILSTTKGKFNDIEVYKIDYSAYYVTLGQYKVEPYFNSFADYKGYTQIKLYLPQLGFVDVDVNECMDKWLQFRLSIDFYSGKGMYIIGVSDNPISFESYPYPHLGEDEGMRILSTFECDIGIDIPLGRSNVGDIKRNMLLGTIKTVANVGAAVYTASLPSPTTTSSTVTTYDVQGRSLSKGSRMKQIKSGTETTNKTTVHNKPVNKSKPISEAIDGSIDTLNRLTVHGNSDRVNDSGLMWSTTGEIKVIIYRPKMIPVDEDFGCLYGYPLGEVKKLSEISGYTEISNVHIEGVGFETITQSEIDMLEEVITSGIIL